MKFFFRNLLGAVNTLIQFCCNNKKNLHQTVCSIMQCFRLWHRHNEDCKPEMGTCKFVDIFASLSHRKKTVKFSSWNAFFINYNERLFFLCSSLAIKYRIFNSNSFFSHFIQLMIILFNIFKTIYWSKWK